MPHVPHYVAGAFVALMVLWQAWRNQQNKKVAQETSQSPPSPSCTGSASSPISPSLLPTQVAPGQSSPSSTQAAASAKVGLSEQSDGHQTADDCLSPLWDLRRWSHTAHAISQDHVLVFGGFGADNTSTIRAADGRLKSIVVLDLKTGKWTPLSSAGSVSPPAREHHVSVFKDNTLWVFGGRAGPHRPFADLWSFDINRRQWTQHEVNSGPVAVFRHSAVLHGNQMIAFGGRTSTGFGNQTWALELKTLKWAQIECKNEPPSARASHASFVYQNKMFVFGGLQVGELADHCEDTRLYALDLLSYEWSVVETTGIKPPPLYSHSVTVVGSHLVCVGGSSAEEVFQYTRVFVLNLGSYSWSLYAGPSWAVSHLSASLSPSVLAASAPSSDSAISTPGVPSTNIPPSGGFFTKHATCAVGNKLLVVGGGGLCFSFGTHFSPSIWIDLEDTRSCVLTHPMKKDFQADSQHDESVDLGSNVVVGSVQPRGTDPTCRVCGEIFTSRNKLNGHLKISKHGINSA